ncbi:MAG: hypothetical protein PHQ23_16165 [Candidatus Wallbacteria bacterium]|nr:hypothetical protein [Candidatus Wallbacteria bacterium]
MKRIIGLLLITALYGLLHAEFEDKNVSARVEALGGAFVAMADDPSSMYYNPAGITLNWRREMICSYSRPFNLNELIHQYTAFTTPFLPYCHLGMGVERFGDGRYQEDTLSFAIAREVVKGHRVGIALKSLGSKIENTDDHWARSVDFGVLSDLGPKTRIGFSARNANHPFVNEQVRSYFRLGFIFQPNDKIKLLTDFIKPQTVTSEDKLSCHIGQEMEIAEGIFVRLGFRTQPERLSYGFGIVHKEIKIDYSYMAHVELASSHRVSMGIKF